MAPTLAFSLDEYRGRLARLRAKMAERGIDTLLAINPVSTCYLTGYQTFGLGTYQCLVVPSTGDPTMLAFELELPGVFLSSWIEDGVAYRSGESPYEATRALLDRRGLSGGRIGVERDSPYISVQNHERLLAALAGCQVVDGAVKLARAAGPEALARRARPGPRSAAPPRTSARRGGDLDVSHRGLGVPLVSRRGVGTRNTLT